MNRLLMIRASAAVTVLLGLLWALQGANLLGGSVMSGEPVWLVLGLAVTVIGLAIAYRTVPSRR